MILSCQVNIYYLYIDVYLCLVLFNICCYLCFLPRNIYIRMCICWISLKQIAENRWYLSMLFGVYAGIMYVFAGFSRVLLFDLFVTHTTRSVRVMPQKVRTSSSPAVRLNITVVCCEACPVHRLSLCSVVSDGAPCPQSESDKPPEFQKYRSRHLTLDPSSIDAPSPVAALSFSHLSSIFLPVSGPFAAGNDKWQGHFCSTSTMLCLACTSS